MAMILGERVQRSIKAARYIGTSTKAFVGCVPDNADG